jgi:hypothetical protein
MKATEFWLQYVFFSNFVLNLGMPYIYGGHVMAEAVSCWPLTVEAQVHTWVNPCSICGGQSGTGTGFSLNSSVFS